VTGCIGHTRRASRRQGFTLLEVIFAIALLVGSLAIIGQHVYSGVRSAVEAEALTTAELLCQSTLAQAIAGAIPLEPAAGVPIETLPDWQYSLEINEVESSSGLLAVRVIVTNAGSTTRPVEFALIRWILDPEYVLQQEEAAADAAAANAPAPSTSTSTTPMSE
jgi:prepilin-type N-terminal cleavage/methylation domain-containing protein